MKDNNYFDEAILFENLYSSLKKSCCNVRWKDSVVIYEFNGLKNTYNLRQHLLNGTYEISPYHEFIIHEPKTREIVATRIKDRQFQRALCDNGLYIDLTESFIKENPACQRGKGNDYTLNCLTQNLKRYYNKNGNSGWFLKCDIHHYFPSTDHKIASAAISKRITDTKAIIAVNQIIDSFGQNGVGIGLGSQVSQLIELCVLDDLDHFIKEKLHIHYYVRYMDDFILIDPNKKKLEECWNQIELFLKKYKLELNRKTTLQPLSSGIRFLKWRFVITDTGRILRLMDYNKVTKQKKKLQKLWFRELHGTVPIGTTEESLDSWIANAKRGDTFAYRKELVKFYCNLTKQKYRYK